MNAYGASTSEAQAESRSIEARCLKEAFSKQDYHRLCAVDVAALSKYSSAKTLSNSGVEQVDSALCPVSIVKDSSPLVRPTQAPAARIPAQGSDDHLQPTGPSDVATYALANSHDSSSSSTTYEAHLKNISENCSVAVQQVGPYAQAKLHASGAFSTVYKAHSTNPPQFLALKVVSSVYKEPHNPLREARILQHAVHPSVVRLLSTSTDENGHLILVFPFLPLDLEAWIGQNKSSPERLSSLAPKLLHNLFSALAHIHSLGLIPSETKPQYSFSISLYCLTRNYSP